MSNRFIDKLERLLPLSANEIALLENITRKSRKVDARQDLIREGDSPGQVFVILDGWACRYKMLPNGSKQILAFLLPGDACDIYGAMIAEMDHSIQTLTPARVATIHRTEIQELITQHPHIAQALWAIQIIDESVLRAWIVSMGRRSSDARFAHLICELYLRARNIGLNSGNNFEMPLSQAVLADALGLTAVHVNRVLRRLREAHIIEFRRGALNIIDPVSLADIAGFDDSYLHCRLRQTA